MLLLSTHPATSLSCSRGPQQREGPASLRPDCTCLSVLPPSSTALPPGPNAGLSLLGSTQGSLCSSYLESHAQVAFHTYTYIIMFKMIFVNAGVRCQRGGGQWGRSGTSVIISTIKFHLIKYEYALCLSVSIISFMFISCKYKDINLNISLFILKRGFQ